MYTIYRLRDKENWDKDKRNYKIIDTKQYRIIPFKWEYIKSYPHFIKFSNGNHSLTILKKQLATKEYILYKDNKRLKFKKLKTLDDIYIPPIVLTDRELEVNTRPSSYMRIPQHIRDEVIKLREDKITYQSIANKFEISLDQVNTIIKKYRKQNKIPSKKYKSEVANEPSTT